MITALKTLESMKDDLSNRYTSFEDKLEYVASFLNHDLQDVIDALSDGLDRIEELEDELSEANDRIEELEREAQ